MKRLFLIALVVIAGANYLVAQVFFRTDNIEINSNTNNEMAPAIYKNGIVFSSDRKSDVVFTTTDQAGSYTYNLYFTERKGRKSWSAPDIFSKELATRYNESSVSFTADGNTVYFTATLGGSDGKVGDDRGDTLKNGIFSSSWNGSSWSRPEAFPYNSEEYDVAYPCISADGNRLYFSARGPKKDVKFDIYYSDKKNGSWTQPVNIGSPVNTAESEVFPFIYKETRLYFSSAGHGGEGGMDLFYSDFRDGEWTTPVNMPKPFNSRSDDFALVANAEMDTGYFVSNRRGTDDIYSFISAFPAFSECPEQVEETFCYDFYEAGSMNLDTTSLGYEWDLGDGNKVRNTRVSHCYKEPGYYLVQLNVIDTLTGDVYFSEATYDLVIEPLEQPYMLSPDTVIAGDNIDFDASQSEIRSFTIENYYWDFGDGGVENEIESRHRYEKPGKYLVRLGITGTNEENPETLQKACASKTIVVKRNR